MRFIFIYHFEENSETQKHVSNIIHNSNITSLIIRKKKGGMRFPYMPPSTDSLLLCTFAVRSRSSALLFILECVAKLAFYLEFTKFFLNYFCSCDNKAEEKAQKRHNDRQKPIISIFYNLFFLFFLIFVNLRFALLFNRFR